MNDIFKVRDLVYSYPKSDKEVLSGISFNIVEGSVFGLLGRSGAGKSTTQKILIKLLSGYGGTVEYLGKPLESYGNSFYEQIGVGFEMPVHFNKLTGRENMKYFASLYKSNVDIDKLLEQVGLSADANMAVGKYSKGMKVRLNFVRAMLNNPKMLFLDEVTNGLDPENARIIKNLIIDFKKNGGTVLLTTHLMNDVEELCDNVAFINEGKIVELSTPRKLKLKYGKRTVDIEYKEDEKLVAVQYPLDAIGNNEQFLQTIKTKNIETIHSGETSLSDIFIQIVKG